MLRPSPTEPTYGLGIWLANDDHQRREEEVPFAEPGIFYLDGRYKQRVYVVPSRELVIVRVGENARGWDEAALAERGPEGLAAEGIRVGQPRPPDGDHPAKKNGSCPSIWVSLASANSP